MQTPSSLVVNRLVFAIHGLGEECRVMSSFKLVAGNGWMGWRNLRPADLALFAVKEAGVLMVR